MKYAAYDPNLKDRMIAAVYDAWLEVQEGEVVRVAEAHREVLMKSCHLMGPTMAKALLVRLYLFVEPRIPTDERTNR